MILQFEAQSLTVYQPHYSHSDRRDTGIFYSFINFDKGDFQLCYLAKAVMQKENFLESLIHANCGC